MTGSPDQFVPTGDIIEDICRRYKQLSSDVQAAAIAERVAKEARMAYGLERVYIPSPRHRERRMAIALIDPSRPVVEQALKLGLNRATVWRHMKRIQKLKP